MQIFSGFRGLKQLGSAWIFATCLLALLIFFIPSFWELEAGSGKVLSCSWCCDAAAPSRAHTRSALLCSSGDLWAMQTHHWHRASCKQGDCNQPDTRQEWKQLFASLLSHRKPKFALVQPPYTARSSKKLITCRAMFPLSGGTENPHDNCVASAGYTHTGHCTIKLRDVSLINCDFIDWHDAYCFPPSSHQKSFSVIVIPKMEWIK